MCLEMAFTQKVKTLFVNNPPTSDQGVKVLEVEWHHLKS